MTDRHPTSGYTQGRGRATLLAVSCLSLVFVLPGCTGLRQAIGLDHTGPDEFAVESRAPLTIPPDFDLRPPQPGASRPQEVTAAERARKVIDTAGPGEPGKQATYALKPTADGGITTAAQTDSTQQVGDQSLAQKLLTSGDGGANAQSTATPLGGVH
ncbi:MAG TPA: DUF3035 domain-containing protein [Stellaceae bacterium]|jgi:hypothetical protein|nr:DUF3035 domain-containing protein [Stellaceae bacterium]